MKKTNILIIVVIVLIAASIYFYKSGGQAPESETLKVNPEVQASAARVLTLLNQIKSLRINADLFTSAEYQTLQDNTVVIPALPVGRINPFAPIPGRIPTTGTTGTAGTSGTSGTRR
jgi:uncharacterized protein YerC